MLARRVGAEGRTRAFVQGRSATAADLQELGGRMVAFFGQHEHRRLTLASAQLELLDGFCGERAPAPARAAGGRARPGAPARARAGGAARASRHARARPRPAGVRDRGDRAARPERRGPRGAAAPSASGCAGSTRCWPPPAAAPRRSRPRPARAAGSPRRWRRPSGWPRASSGVDPELDALGAAARRRCAWRPRTSAPSCAATSRGSRPIRAGCSRSRSGSTSTTG